MNNLATSISITSRAEIAFNSLEHEFASIYSKRDFKKMIETLKGVKDASARRVNYMPELYGMLDDCEIPYEKDKDPSYYENLIDKNMDDERYGAKSIEERMVLTLFDMYENYTEPAVYMERIVSRLTREEDARKWDGSSLRLRILKQFIKYGKYLDAAGYSGRTKIEKMLKEKGEKKKYTVGEASDVVDETVFACIDDPDIKASEKKTKYSLMKLADDLAQGKFRTNGATKKGLYLFAMVYGMTLPGFPGADDKNDVIKNLFRDYYNNNLMSYLNEGYRNHLREFETNPSGQGVNFKNFAEMIFLYYIVKEIDPAEKISKLYAMINEVTEAAKKSDMRNEADERERNTKYYKGKILAKDGKDTEIVFSENIFSKSEEEFKKFLLENYDCDVRTGKVHESKGKTIEETTPPIQMDLDQNTAYEKYLELMELLNEELSKKGMWTSYKDLYEVFKSELDPYLTDAGYQEVSSKSIFDVLLTFSSYARTLPV